MANGKSDAKSCSLRMDADIFAGLNQYCDRTGTSKTRVIEITLTPRSSTTMTGNSGS